MFFTIDEKKIWVEDFLTLSNVNELVQKSLFNHNYKVVLRMWTTIGECVFILLEPLKSWIADTKVKKHKLWTNETNWHHMKCLFIAVDEDEDFRIHLPAVTPISETFTHKMKTDEAAGPECSGSSLQTTSPAESKTNKKSLQQNNQNAHSYRMTCLQFYKLNYASC